MAVFSTTDVVKLLFSSRCRPSGLNPPERPGIYAIFLRDQEQIGWFAAKSGSAVYVGISGNLKQREFDVHFSSGSSGFSTLRRSLGAILKNELNLTCRPRSSGPSETNVTNYKFDEAGEQRLTLWMAENLDIGICPVDQNIKDLEKAVIAETKPVLNLTGWKNPDRASIKELRAACKREAKSRRM
jgi:GIY-YIG catalytic domain